MMISSMVLAPLQTGSACTTMSPEAEMILRGIGCGGFGASVKLLSALLAWCGKSSGNGILGEADAAHG